MRRGTVSLLLAARGHGLPFKGKDLAAIGMKANAKAPRERLKEVTTVAVSLARQLPGRESLSDKALEKLVEAGFDPVYGARPLKRAIQQQLENPLAQALLKGEFGPGDTIEVDVAGSEMVFRKG